ncbi:alpha/beta hydrolase [Nocardioidaceae bacterium]|nr:alpha/beta hydrolase [Nocardioidaceae bacterium]
MAIGEFLLPEGFEAPRGLRTLGREASVLPEAGRWARQTAAERWNDRSRPYVGPDRSRSNAPVLLIPGFLAGDSSLTAMSHHLRRRGYRTYRAQIHANVGCTLASADRLERRLEAIALRREQRVTIVGHSLGGMLARGLAARRPDLVEGIVTMGSPMVAPGAAHTVLQMATGVFSGLSAAGLRAVMSADCLRGECAKESYRLSQVPLADDQGFTAIYSKRDGVVDWRACLGDSDHTVEATCSHIGMAVEPQVMRMVEAALAEHARRRRTALPAQHATAG